MDDNDLLQTTDAAVWAERFMEKFGGRRDTIDAGLMLAWFASAIETGRGPSRAASPHLAQDEGLRKAAQELWEHWEHEDAFQPSYRHTLGRLLDNLGDALAAPLRVAREGYVSIEDVEKTIISLYCYARGADSSAAEFVKNVRSRLTKPRSAEQGVTECRQELFSNKFGTTKAVVCSCGFATTYSVLNNNADLIGMEHFRKLHDGLPARLRDR